MKQNVLDCLTFLANAVGETMASEDYWSPTFCHKNIKDAFGKVCSQLREDIDWNNLTEQDCRELRFGIWEKENPLRLIPIWLHKVIPHGTKLTSISGEEIEYKGQIDLDHRFGCLAWGIIPKEK